MVNVKIRIVIKLFLVTIATVCFIQCSEEQEVRINEIKRAIENEIVLFEEDGIPVQLQNQLEENQTAIFGETHFVQEHQDFILHALPELNALGYNVIFDEQFHCFNWMIEDYINGDIDDLPEFLLYFNETLIEGIKDFNSAVEESRKIHLVYMDLNNWQSNFVTCLEEIEKIIGTQPDFSSIKNAGVDSDIYRVELQNLLDKLETDSVSYVSSWGEKWYKRLIRIIPVEIVSSEFRTGRNNALRESVIYENILNEMANHADSKFLINTGMFHAQKEIYMGENLERLGKRLTANFEKTFSIAFVGIKGERKQNFADANNINFDLSQSTSSDDVIKDIYEFSLAKMSYLPLNNEVFSNQTSKITYVGGTTVEAPIGRQFDAIITYPEISTLKSMDVYDWQ